MNIYSDKYWMIGRRVPSRFDGGSGFEFEPLGGNDRNVQWCGPSNYTLGKEFASEEDAQTYMDEHARQIGPGAFIECYMRPIQFSTSQTMTTTYAAAWRQ